MNITDEMIMRIGDVVIERDGLKAENAALRAAVKLCWDALDSLYGGDAFEALPIEVMTPDRRNACNAALKAIGALEI
jgi:hypothetical protein